MQMVVLDDGPFKRSAERHEIDRVDTTEGDSLFLDDAVDSPGYLCAVSLTAAKAATDMLTYWKRWSSQARRK